MTQYIIICDIDNCFTDSREWVKYAPLDVDEKDKSVFRERWDRFHSLSFLAKPNKSVIDFLLSISELTPIYFVTSREDRKEARKDTENQISKFSNGKIVIGDKHKLFMRKEFDYRASAVIKEEIVREILDNDCIPVLAIDDDKSNCEMFCKLGIPTKLYNIETDTFEKYLVPEAV